MFVLQNAWVNEVPASTCIEIIFHVHAGADRHSPTAIFTDANIDWNLRGFAIESHSLNRGDPILIAYHTLKNERVSKAWKEFEVDNSCDEFPHVVLKFCSDTSSRTFQDKIVALISSLGDIQKFKTEPFLYFSPSNNNYVFTCLSPDGILFPVFKSAKDICWTHVKGGAQENTPLKHNEG
jgi:hypothetical protein